MNWIIMAAGGDGKRIKNNTANKIFLPTLGRPIIFYTLKTLEETDFINKIIITVRKKDRKRLKKLIFKWRFKKIVSLIAARESRQTSTWKVLNLWKDIISVRDLVGVHNAVNPLVTKEEIQAVFAAARQHGASLLATPATDTIKIAAENGLVEKTPVRDFVWCAQTPQVARFGLLFKAFQEAEKEGFIATDDAQLLERVGAEVKIVPCSPENFKITYPQDLFLMEKILKRREENESGDWAG